MSKLRLGVFVAVLVPWIAGCVETGPELAEVTGVVTLNGEPLDKIRVEFQPLVDGPNSAGLTDAQGRYVLTTLDGVTKGAVVGKHKVLLHDVGIVKRFVGRNEEASLTDGAKRRLHSKYSSLMESPLEVNVSSGNNPDINFEVEPFEG